MNYSAKLLSDTVETATQSPDTITTVGEMSDGVVNIAKAINDFGPVIVVMAIFFILFLGLAVLVLRNNAKMMSQLMKRQETSDRTDQQIITKFVEKALDDHDSKNEEELKSVTGELKESIDSLQKTIASMQHQTIVAQQAQQIAPQDDYHKDLVGAFIDVNMAFKDASRTALSALNCDRIAIYVFHNGNSSIHGLPFFKMSCIHEWTSKGGGSGTLRGKYHADLPLHQFNDFIEDLWKDGIYKADNIKTVGEKDKSILEFTAFSNTQALYMIGIRDSDEKLAGFITAEFTEADTFNSDEERDKFINDTLHEMIGKVAPIIANHYVYKSSSNSQ